MFKFIKVTFCWVNVFISLTLCNLTSTHLLEKRNTILKENSRTIKTSVQKSYEIYYEQGKIFTKIVKRVMLEFLSIINSVSFWLKYYYIFTTFLCDNYRKFCYQGPKETILFVTIALALPRKVQLEKLLEQRKLLKSFLAKFSPYPKLFFVYIFLSKVRYHLTFDHQNLK